MIAPHMRLEEWACITYPLRAGSLEDTIALARKALANDGIATAWKLSQNAIVNRVIRKGVVDQRLTVCRRDTLEALRIASKETIFVGDVPIDPGIALIRIGLCVC